MRPEDPAAFNWESERTARRNDSKHGHIVPSRFIASQPPFELNRGSRIEPPPS